MQAGHPALGALLDDLHLVWLQLQAVEAVEKLGRLLQVKAQICRAHLGQLAAGAQARHRQGRQHAGEHCQADLRRQALDQRSQGLVDGGVADGVVIVQHDEGRPFQGGEAVDEQGDAAFQRRGRVSGQNQPGLSG